MLTGQLRAAVSGLVDCVETCYPFLAQVSEGSHVWQGIGSGSHRGQTGLVRHASQSHQRTDHFQQASAGMTRKVQSAASISGNSL